MTAVRVRRVYDEPAADDGTRVLVDRLWPRGMRKADAPFDRWLKGVAPSTALRTWYQHDPAKWDAFRRRYEEELGGAGEQADALAELRSLSAQGRVTVLTASRAVDISEARVLADLLDG